MSCGRAVFCAAQRQLEEEMAEVAGQGEVRLDAAQQAEFYRIKEEAKSKTSKLQADHDALLANQVRTLVIKT